MLEHLLHGTWKELLWDEMKKPYFKTIENEVMKVILNHGEICPSVENIFRAFDLCPYENVKVVIIGQDPYMNPGQATGLAFSVPPGVRTPPSLQNIFKALKNDLGCTIPNNGCLDYWAEQGVLLMNSMLTYLPHQNNQYLSIGWQLFTDAVVNLLNDYPESLVFMLWGRYAHQKAKHVDRERHLILKHNHPSPIIANNTFIYCDHFSRANMFLYETTPYTIDWQIKDI